MRCLTFSASNTRTEYPAHSVFRPPPLLQPTTCFCARPFCDSVWVAGLFKKRRLSMPGSKYHLMRCLDCDAVSTQVTIHLPAPSCRLSTMRSRAVMHSYYQICSNPDSKLICQGQSSLSDSPFFHLFCSSYVFFLLFCYFEYFYCFFSILSHLFYILKVSFTVEKCADK